MTTVVLQFGHSGEAVGDSLYFPLGSSWRRRFNSATAVKPWVTWRNVEDEHLEWRSFNSATAVKPWVTTQSYFLVLRSRTGFNSATAVKPWVTLNISTNREQIGHASIRPQR